MPRCKDPNSFGLPEPGILETSIDRAIFLWSSARIGGVPIGALVEQRGETLDSVRKQIEQSVRYANIAIIEGNDASQFGIGIVSARIAE